MKKVVFAAMTALLVMAMAFAQAEGEVKIGPG